MKFELSQEVASALAERRPVVAVESTIIAHRFTLPDKLAGGQAQEAAQENRSARRLAICVPPYFVQMTFCLVSVRITTCDSH